MKKKILFLSLFVATVAAAGLYLSQNGSEVTVSDAVTANVKAMAETTCFNGCLENIGCCTCHGEHDYEEANWDSSSPD
jgi:hypothetical protein